MEDLGVNSRLTIPAAQLVATYSRSSGPGGQNVNKVNSRVTLRWQVDGQPLLAHGWRQRLQARFASRISREGELVVHSEKYRDQPRNLADCRQRLAELLRECAAPPVQRKKTRPTMASQRRRLDDKRRQSQKKSHRRGPSL
jgi:ribosome-associated protein